MAATPIQGSCCSTISVVCTRRCFAISRNERKQSQEKLLELFPDLLYCVYLFLGKKEAFELPSVAFLRPSTGRLCPYDPSFSNRLYPLRVRTLQRPSLFFVSCLLPPSIVLSSFSFLQVGPYRFSHPVSCLYGLFSKALTARPFLSLSSCRYCHRITLPQQMLLGLSASFDLP